MRMHPLHVVLNNTGNDSEDHIVLPPNLRCVSRTLNLTSIHDIEKWLSSNAESRAVYRSATAKCYALWTKPSTSSVAEMVKMLSRRKLLAPITIR